MTGMRKKHNFLLFVVGFKQIIPAAIGWCGCNFFYFKEMGFSGSNVDTGEDLASHCTAVWCQPAGLGLNMVRKRRLQWKWKKKKKDLKRKPLSAFSSSLSSSQRVVGKRGNMRLSYWKKYRLLGINSIKKLWLKQQALKDSTSPSVPCLLSCQNLESFHLQSSSCGGEMVANIY